MNKLNKILRSSWAPWLFAATLCLFSAALAVWFGGLNQDEGWYLYAAQLVRSGKLPYRDFFFTQGPALPLVYSLLAPVWGQGSPVSGLLGGRLVTLALGLLATAFAVGLARLLVPAARRGLAGFAVFALLAGNLYHLYFTTIPKTYALGSLFLLAGLFLVARGLGCAEDDAETAPTRAAAARALQLVAGGLLLAFATGTRISLVLILPVAGLVLLARFRALRWSFLWLGLGGALGGFLTYGFFALDPTSLCGLLAAQSYHAARGGFDPFFALGSVSRLARGYAALGVVLFALGALAARATRQPPAPKTRAAAARSTMRWTLGLGFAAVFALQLSAPFPYDDYQVPIMGMLTALIVSGFATRVRHVVPAMWFVVLVAGLVSFTSPQLQDWATYGADRFWSRKKEMTELAKLREVGREIKALDPDGTTMLTQDLYLAVETGRTVPEGLEMGPFSYFPDLPDDVAAAWHVHNRASLAKLLASAPCSLAACSGYAFAIAAPTCAETPFSEQTRFFDILKTHYDLRVEEPDFGQNATTLLLLTRKTAAR